MTKQIDTTKTYLGIEFGSTRIKAVLIDDSYNIVASSAFDWENQLVDGYWTYSLDLIHDGIRACFASLQEDFKSRYGTPITEIGAMGFSGMMHGYLAFDAEDNLLVPFRTWRNTTTAKAAEVLSEKFHFNIPQRWSIAHLYQAMLNGEAHVTKIAHITTIAGYIHYLLSGRHEVGIGEASGIFPIENGAYSEPMLKSFDELSEDMPWDLRNLLPEIRCAGESGAYLTAEGAKFLDPTGALNPGVPLCPPEGDGPTGMTATNAVAPGTGNISAGTSVFSMLVLSKPLDGIYPEIDIITTPEGYPTAMVHSNNGCSELDAIVKNFIEFAQLSGNPISKSDCYELLYRNAMSGDADCGGVVSYNFLAGEPVAGVEKACPLTFRTQDSEPTLANVIRSQLYASIASIKLGMDMLSENEKIEVNMIKAHGGLFKVKGVAQQILADALDTPISTEATAGEGGAWGMALLAAYMIKKQQQTLGEWLESEVFAGQESLVLNPTKEGRDGFNEYIKRYKSGISMFSGLNK